jgi:hypothetical protein
MYRGDARVLQLTGDVCLVKETPDQIGSPAQVGPHDFDGDVPAEALITAQVDGAHAAFAK